MAFPPHTRTDTARTMLAAMLGPSFATASCPRATPLVEVEADEPSGAGPESQLPTALRATSPGSVAEPDAHADRHSSSSDSGLFPGYLS
jgi:hypothetical protein